ncbi:MAG: RecX family transcriptional regulator [Eubacteriales bacterium]|nr:RecX family transcriptional regulator [Eubacteriales bacterium]
MASLGKITRIEQQKHRKNRLSIFLDEAFFHSVADTVWVESGLRVGQELEEETWRELSEKHESRAAMDHALYLLGIRMYSRRELEQKLRQKGFEDAAIAPTLEKLEGYGYVNDAQMAQMMVREAQSFKGQGPRALRQTMIKKGMDGQTIAAALEGFDAGVEEALVREQLPALLRRYAREEDPRKRRGKISAALQRKGFSWEAIRAAMGEQDEQEEIQ